MKKKKYIMESDDEVLRLDLKTDGGIVEEHARWAGLKPGMQVADLGCGSGKTTWHLHKVAAPDGRAVGVDIAESRVDFARKQYGKSGIEFVCRDIGDSLDDLGRFDFVWVRFVLEYHRENSFKLVRNMMQLLKPGGILCLVDLDYNCLSHYGLSQRLEKTIAGIMHTLEAHADFDPYTGRKLYSYLYDLEFTDIDLKLAAHHLIFGELDSAAAFNWTQKVVVAAQNSGYSFDEYPGGYDEFYQEFESFFKDPRRFTYTPVIVCRGCKPLV